jgi:hypothetical protein
LLFTGPSRLYCITHTNLEASSGYSRANFFFCESLFKVNQNFPQSHIESTEDFLHPHSSWCLFFGPKLAPPVLHGILRGKRPIALTTQQPRVLGEKIYGNFKCTFLYVGRGTKIGVAKVYKAGAAVLSWLRLLLQRLRLLFITLRY